MLKKHYIAVEKIRRIVDTLITVASFFITYALIDLSMGGYYFYRIEKIWPLLIPIIMIWWVVLNQQKLYLSHRFEPLISQIPKLLKALVICNVLFLATITLLKLFHPGRFFWGFFMGIDTLLLILLRILSNGLSAYFRKKGYNYRRVVIIGLNAVSLELATLIRIHKEWGLHIEGFIVPAESAAEKEEIQRLKTSGRLGETILGTLDEFYDITRDMVIDIAYFTVSAELIHDCQGYIKYCLERGINTKLSINYFFESMDFVKADLDQMENLSLLSFETTHFSLYAVLLKEVIDRLFALIWIILLLPVFIATAIAIKLESGGPILFTQSRVGQNGRLFKIYKFRSMVVDAEALKEDLQSQNEMSGPVFKMTHDPRVTKVGKFIRKTSIDELPQLLNVLFGDMSMVGPRPPLPTETSQYDNWQRRRLTVKPGITCTWQISGRNNIDFYEWMKMDLDYIDNWTFTNDLRLMAKTLPAIFKQTGAK